MQVAIALVRDNKITDIYQGFDVEALEAALGLQGGTYHDNPEGKSVGSWWIEPEPDPLPEPLPMPEPAWLTAESVVWWIESKYQALLSEFPEGEKTSWDTQVSEAKSLLENTQALTPFIDSQSAITEEPRAELAQKILQKAGELWAFSGLLTGLRRQTIARIQAGEQLLVTELETILATALGGQ